MTRYQAFEQSDGPLLVTEDNARTLRELDILLPTDILLYEFDAATPEEASAIHNLRQGFEPYKPMWEAARCPDCNAWYYPEGSGICWRCGEQKEPLFRFPPPREMTEEAAERIARESEQCRIEFEELLRPMEEIGPDDLKTRVR